MHVDKQPDAKEAKQVRSKLWEQKEHNRKTELCQPYEIYKRMCDVFGE